MNDYTFSLENLAAYLGGAAVDAEMEQRFFYGSRLRQAADVIRSHDAVMHENDRLRAAIRQHRIDTMNGNRTWSADDRLWDSCGAWDDAEA